MLSKWSRLGLQLRIMAYVAIGLIVLFGGVAYLGTQAVREATDQVFSERTAFAQSLAHDLDKDFRHLVLDLQLGADALSLQPREFQTVADRLYSLLYFRPGSTWFRVSSVRIVDEQGQLLAAAPASEHDSPLPAAADIRLAIMQNRPLVLRSQVAAEGQVSFAFVVAPLSADWAYGQSLAVIVNTVGVSDIPPAVPGGGTAYSLEIFGLDGATIVSTARPEEAGEKSRHYTALSKYVETGRSGAEVHRMPRGSPVGDHVAAIAPLDSGPFYLLLEQPVDLALTLPRQRRHQTIAVSLAGVILSLAVAYYTTRAVVRPVGRLRAATRAIAEGSLDSPVHVRAQDELSELVEDIETMRQQLKRSRDDLEQAKLELEGKVEERTRRLQETLGKVFNAQEEERRRLARELHDEQSQALSAISVSLDRLSRLAGPVSPDLLGEIEQAREMAGSLLRETRRLIYDLRPSVLDDMGLEAAIRWCAEAHLQRQGVQVTIKSVLAPGRLPAPVEVALYRVAQEAIVNIERHAQAGNAGVVLEQHDSSLRMHIWDDGKGFDPDSIGSGVETSGVGLEGMRERVRLIGGAIEVVSAPGRGVALNIEVPLD